MSELLSSLVTDEVRNALIIVAALIVVLYVLSIVWVIRDAYLRGAKWQLWGIIAIIPIAGLVAYCLLRPPLTQVDRDEQELEIAYKQRELQKYGQCAACGYPVTDEYIVCPNCRTQLKNQCSSCGKPLDPHWGICPYCATMVSGHPNQQAAQPRRRQRPQQQAQTEEQQAQTRQQQAQAEEQQVRQQQARQRQAQAARAARRRAE